MSAIIGSKKIDFSEEQGMLLDVAREFVKDKSPGSEVRKLLESEAGFSEPVWQELVDLGWTGINLPESVGGSGLGIAALIPVVESMGKGLMGTPLVSTVLAAELIRRAGGIAEEDVLEDISGGCAATVAYLDGSDWGGTNTGVSVDATASCLAVSSWCPMQHKPRGLRLLGQMQQETLWLRWWRAAMSRRRRKRLTR